MKLQYEMSSRLRFMRTFRNFSSLRICHNLEVGSAPLQIQLHCQLNNCIEGQGSLPFGGVFPATRPQINSSSV